MGSFVGGDASGGVGSTTQSVTWPTTADGDLAILIAGQNSARAFTNPTEFGTPVDTITDGSCEETFWLRTCDGSESGSMTLTQDGTGAFTLALFVVRGYTGIDVRDSAARPTNSTTIDCPSVTPTVADAGVIVTCTARITSEVTTATAPSSFDTNKTEFGTGGTGAVYIGIAWDGGGVSRTASVAVDPGDWSGLLSTGDDGVARTIALTPTASGATVEGAATATFGFTGTAAGVPRTSGVATATLGFTATAAGVPETFGVAAASLGFAGTSSGVRRALGTAAAALGFTATGAGVPDVQGVAVASFGFTGAASGTVGSEPVTGVAVASFGFTGTAAGIDRALGVALASLGFTATSSGIDRSLGSGSAALGFTATAQGAVDTPAVTGSASAAFGFSATVAGQPRTLGVGVASFDFAGTATGERTVLGVAVATFGFTGITIGVNLSIVAPASRTFTVPAEPRAYAVAAESRTFTVPAESRTLEA